MPGPLAIIIPLIQKLTERPLTISPTEEKGMHDNREEYDADNDAVQRDFDDMQTRGRSTPRWTPNGGRRDTRFRSFPSTSTWSSELSTNVSSRLPKTRAALHRFWDFILQNDNTLPEEFIPNYRWLPILSAVTIPFSILLQIPGCTERWYVRTLDNKTIQSRPNPPILLTANIFAMMVALIANLCLIARFLEKRVKQMTIIAICLLGFHDIVNAVVVTVFGVEHRFNDGFTYGQPFWLVVASTVVSLFTTITLIWDLWTTPEFSKSGSGLTRKQRSLVIIVMILLCWITLGGLVNSILLHLSYIDGLYFTVVSIETIGFGDIHPDSTGSRIFSIIYNSIGVLNIGLAISTARETIIESFEVSYRRRVNEVATKRAEYKKLKETQRTRKHAIERMLNNAGLPAYVSDPLRPAKLKLNEEALTPAQLSAAENEALHIANRRTNRNGVSGDGTRTPGPMFERTFTMESTATDLYPNGQFSEENYKNFKMGIIREERREFAAKLAVAWTIFLTFWLIGAGIFSQTEKWDYGIALYFCFVAFSSIGYGDFSPATPAGRSVFVVWALLGVGAMTILISVLSEACSSRYKNALSRGSFERAVKNFRARRATSQSPHFSPSRVRSRSHSRDVSPDTRYTVEHAKKDLEALPSELLSHAKTFHEHIYYFLSSMDSSEPPPPTLEKMLHEIADSEHMDEGLKLEVLGDDGARKALFMMSYEGALRKMIQTAEKAVSLLSHRDVATHTRDQDSEMDTSKAQDPKLRFDLDEQRYMYRRPSTYSQPQGLSSKPDLQDPTE